MKKIWQTHILQDTKLKRKEIKKKSALTILFQIITKKVELNLKFNPLQQSKMRLTALFRVPEKSNYTIGKCFPIKRKYFFSPINVAFDSEILHALRFQG